MGWREARYFSIYPLGATRSLIRKWQPGKCTTEKDYKKSLYNFLHAQLDDIQVTQEYGLGRTHADIVVGDEVLIEFKHNLSSTSEYQRLLGQLAEYDEGWNGYIFLVLTGETEPNLRKQLGQHLENTGLSTGMGFFRPKVTVIDK